MSSLYALQTSERENKSPSEEDMFGKNLRLLEEMGLTASNSYLTDDTSCIVFPKGYVPKNWPDEKGAGEIGYIRYNGEISLPNTGYEQIDRLQRTIRRTIENGVYNGPEPFDNTNVVQINPTITKVHASSHEEPATMIA